MINQAFQALGFGEGFTMEEARTAWREIGPLLDKAEEQVAAVAESSGRAPAAIPDAAGPSAAPAAPEPPPAQ